MFRSPPLGVPSVISIPESATEVDVKMSDFKFVPTIDLAMLDNPSSRTQLVQQLRQALLDVGMFYVANPPLSPTVVAEAKTQSEAFFALPFAEKTKLDIANSPSFLGYAMVRAALD